MTVSDAGWDYNGPTAIEPEPFTVLLDNQSEHQVVAVSGWLTGDATWEDLEAWTSTEQPPWLEVGSFALADPRVQAIWTIDPTHTGDNVLVGLDLALEQVAWRQMLTVTE